MAGGGGMALDPRQVVAGFLTISMFVMIGNMIKHDHFDSSVEVNIQGLSDTQFDAMKLEEHTNSKVSMVSMGPWKERDRELKPCFGTLNSINRDTRGFITFSLTIGPEYHISQVSEAVVIARYIGATLVIPDIRRNEVGQKREFADLYDLKKFISGLQNVVKVAHELPSELSSRKPAVIRVPHRVTKDFIEKNIRPLFKTNNYVRLAVYFPSQSLKLTKPVDKERDSAACLSMFGILEPKAEISQVADEIVERLRALSTKSNGQFVAVDLKLDMLKKKRCMKGDTSRRKSCYNAQEIADFLKRVGFNVDTTIFVTESWWDESLNPLKAAFPKTYTKDDVIPAEKKQEFLNSGTAEIARAMDLHICSESDVFVPAYLSHFYAQVTGKRIRSGRTQVLVPSEEAATGSSSPSDFISTYISRKNHFVYSCFC